jgi:hypothetical protein
MSDTSANISTHNRFGTNSCGNIYLHAKFTGGTPGMKTITFTGG